MKSDLDQENSSTERYRQFRDALDKEYLMLYSYAEKVFSSIQANENIFDADQSKSCISAEVNSITPYLLKHSIFISVYSFMEYSLKEFCKIVADKLGKHQRRVSDFDKAYQYYYFLTDEILLDNTRADKDWEQLSIFKDIRNSIVHYNSSIGKNISTKSYQFIKDDPRIRFEETGKFKIEDVELIYELISVSKRLLFALMDSFELKYQNFKVN